MLQRKLLFTKIREAITMNRYNKFESKEENVVDIELLRIEKLIEERESYEAEFFSLEPPADNLDNIISKYCMEIECHAVLNNLEDDLDDPFEFEEYLNQIRDERLIEEREAYEKEYFSIADENGVLDDIFEYRIASREEEEFIQINGYEYDFNYEPEYEPDFEFDQYEEDMFYELLYLKQESQMASQQSCSCAYMDYMPNDDGLCDYLDCYDYPEGPDENLCGIKFL